MLPKVIFLGSIGVIAETSDIQRRAYNQALQEAGLTWHWDKATYRDLLTQSGGQKRLRRLGVEAGEPLDGATVTHIHARKTEIACDEIRRDGVDLRPGVDPLIRRARENGIGLMFVTTTYQANIDAILAGARPALAARDFAHIFTVEDVRETKPSPEVYLAALNKAGVAPGQALAIEDSAVSVASAKAAGVYCMATPGAFTDTQDFSEADQVRTSLEGLDLAAALPG